MDQFLIRVTMAGVGLAVHAIPIRILWGKRNKLMLLQSPPNINYEAKTLYAKWFKNYHQAISLSIWRRR